MPNGTSDTTRPDFKSGLAEASKAYLSFVDLKHKIWTLFFAVSAGLATYYWASQYYARGQGHLGWDQLIGIRILGFLSCVFTALSVFRTQRLVDHFESKVAEYSRELGLPNFAERDRTDGTVALARGAIAAVNAWYVWIEIGVIAAAAVGWCAIGWIVIPTANG